MSTLDWVLGIIGVILYGGGIVLGGLFIAFYIYLWL